MPFAEYEDFDDCVRKNQDKNDHEAYCAAIKEKVEGKCEKVKNESPLSNIR